MILSVQPLRLPAKRICLLFSAALFAAGFTIAVPGPLRAETQIEAKQQYHIASGLLSEVLSQFAGMSNIALSFDASVFGNRRSAGLNGSYTISSGFQTLLTGSGYIAVHQGGNRYILQQPGERDGKVTLSAINIGAKQAPVSGETMTERSGSYTTGGVNSLNRLNMSLRETPQTVTVVTKQQIDDFGYINMDDVLRSTSGVYVYNRGLNGGAYYSRGFTMQSQYDGVPNPSGIGEGHRNPSPDSAILDHVEILQGASGLLTGSGEPGGTVNMVRKMPTASTQYGFELSGGSWDFQRMVGDVSGALTESGNIKGRVVAAYQKQNSFVDYAFENQRTFYGVLTVDITEKTTLTTQVQIQDKHYNQDYGTILGPQGQDLGFSRSRFFGAHWAEIEKENQLYTLRLDHQFNQNWQFRAAFNHSETDLDSRSPYLSGDLDVATGNGLVSRYVPLVAQQSNNVFDGYLAGKVKAFGREHELVFGANTSWAKEQYVAPIEEVKINLYSYSPSTRPYPVNPVDPYYFSDTIKQEAIYSAARISLTDSLKLIMGGRLNWYESEDSKEVQEVTPYAGLVKELNDTFSVYASYSDIFTPQSDKKVDGSTLKPVIGSNYEVGIKGAFFDGGLNASLAAFRLEQTNLAEKDESIPYDKNNACNGYCYKAAGKVITDGVDIGLSGALTPNWQMMAGYTFINSEYDTGEDKGKRYNTIQPEHLFRVSSLYHIPTTKWSVGGDLHWQSGIYRESTDYHIGQSSYALVGLLTKYQIDSRSELKLNIRNLFDNEYYESVGSPNFFTNYGAPRSAYLSYNIRFH